MSEVRDGNGKVVLRDRGGIHNEIERAREGEYELDDRLDKIDSQLAEKVSSTNIKNVRDAADIFEYSIDGVSWKQINSSGGSSGGSSYVLELSRWGVKNDETSAVNTTLGINNAMTWAVANGYAEIVLPKGTYLIDKNSCIEPQSYLTLNINGATLKKETNGLTGYAIVSFKKDQKYSRVTNGIIKGDRATHDYVTIAGTHEGGYGIEVGNFAGNSENNARYITLDNLEIKECTGDAISLNSAFNQISPVPTALASSWETGGINATTGVLETNATKIRSTLNIDLTQTMVTKYGYFGLYGNGFGGLGSDIIADYFDVFFYKPDNSFVSVSTFVQFFDEVEVPVGATYAKIMMHQPTVPLAANCTINVRVPTFSKFVYIEKCNLHDARRQGITIAGAKNVYITGNEIHHIGGKTNELGVAPQSGIDIEDGADLNQFIHIDNNSFHHNERYNIIVVNGKHINITNNTLLQTNTQGYVSLTVNGAVDKAVVSGNIIKLGKVDISGECLFSNNFVFGTQVNISPTYSTRPIVFANSSFFNCKLLVDSPFAYLINVTGCTFFNDGDKIRLATQLWTLEVKQEPQTFSDCTFQGQDVSYLTYNANGATFKGGWVFTNCVFKDVKQPGLFAGTYTNCVFRDLTATIGITKRSDGTDFLDIRNCKFYAPTLNNNIIVAANLLKSFKMVDCLVEKLSGWTLTVDNVSEELLIRGNTFRNTNETLNRAHITLNSTFTGNSLILDGNRLINTTAIRLGIDNLTTNNPPTMIIRNNVLTKATMNLNGKEIAYDNIVDGQRDPSFRGTAAPTTTPNFIGQEFFDTTNKKLYRAFGITSSADWVIMN